MKSIDLSNPKPGLTTGGSGRGNARRGGGAGWCGEGQNADGTVRPQDNHPSCPPDDCPERLSGSTNKRNPM